MQNSDLNALKEQIDALQKEISDLKSGNTNQRDEEAGAQSSWSEQFDAFSALLGKKFDEGDEVVERLESEIKAHPLKAVGIAVGIGYLIAKVIGFRR